eukprot:8695175-Ditylum_brightwellii.AAC.1
MALLLTLLIKLGDGLGHSIEVEFDFLQGFHIKEYSGADFCHEVSNGHNLFLLQFLEAFGYVTLQVEHH